MKLLVFAFILLQITTMKSQAEESLLLSPGELKTLQVPLATPIKVSKGRVLQAKDLGSSLAIYGKKAGSSLLYLGDRKINVQVIPQSELNFFKEITDAENAKLNLTYELKDGEILVRGQLHRLSDWLWLAEQARIYGASYKFLAEVDRDVQKSLEEEINKHFVANSLSPARWAWSPYPQVHVAQQLKSQTSSYNDVLKPFGLTVESRKGQIHLSPTVQVEVVIAEVVQRVDKELGLDWSPFGEFQILPRSNFSSSLSSILRMLEKRGLGKVLATPRILCRSGSEAEFHSGGEFPIPITEYQSHYKSRNVIWKKHGILLKFKPLADHQGRLSLKVLAELSMISEQQAGEGIPALLTNKIESHFDLSKPQTVALSGLIRQDWHRGSQGLPWISQIPVFGQLFKSESFLNRKSELVVFVTPKIIEEEDSKPELPNRWGDESL